MRSTSVGGMTARRFRPDSTTNKRRPPISPRIPSIHQSTFHHFHLCLYPLLPRSSPVIMQSVNQPPKLPVAVQKHIDDPSGTGARFLLGENYLKHFPPGYWKAHCLRCGHPTHQHEWTACERPCFHCGMRHLRPDDANSSEWLYCSGKAEWFKKKGRQIQAPAGMPTSPPSRRSSSLICFSRIQPARQQLRMVDQDGGHIITAVVGWRDGADIGSLE
jgi:hypothetical protein